MNIPRSICESLFDTCATFAHMCASTCACVCAHACVGISACIHSHTSVRYIYACVYNSVIQHIHVYVFVLVTNTYI